METIIPAGMITLKKSARPKHAFLFLNEKKYLHRASILTKLTNASSLEDALLVRPSPLPLFSHRLEIKGAGSLKKFVLPLVLLLFLLVQRAGCETRNAASP